MANARPVTQIRLGVVRASIWANETTNGTRYSVTVGRLYMKDSEWKTSSSFGHDELLVLCKTLDMAYMWIAERNATRRSAGSGATAVEDMGNEGHNLTKIQRLTKKLLVNWLMRLCLLRYVNKQVEKCYA